MWPVILLLDYLIVFLACVLIGFFGKRLYYRLMPEPPRFAPTPAPLIMAGQCLKPGEDASHYRYWALGVARGLSREEGIKGEFSIPVDAGRFVALGVAGVAYHHGQVHPLTKAASKRQRAEVLLLMGACLVILRVDDKEYLKIPLGVLTSDSLGGYPAAITGPAGSRWSYEFRVPNAQARAKLRKVPLTLWIEIALSGYLIRRKAS